MKPLTKLFRSVRAILQKQKLNQELDEELQFHIRPQTEENIRTGMRPEAARCAARRKFGWVENIKENCRDVRRVKWIEDALIDVRYGTRILARNPGYTVVGVLTLALAIGASTAVFSVINAFILNPVPLPTQDRLIEINTTYATHDYNQGICPLAYEVLEQHPELIERLATYENDSMEIPGDEFVEEIYGGKVTPSFFVIIGIHPLLGRPFLEQEGRPGQRQLLIISHAFWEERFGKAADVIGRTLTCKDGMFQIVGVMPAHFQFPYRRVPYALDRPIQYWRPFQASSAEIAKSSNRHEPVGRIFARLPARTARTQAQAFLDILSKRLEKELPESYKELYKGLALRVRPLRDSFVDPSVRRTLWILMGAIGFVLLIASANMANLQLARAEPRTREISVRMAMGAGRGRILRQCLTESLLISAAGGVLGLVVAFWGSKAMALLVPSYVPVMRALSIDAGVLGCTAILTGGAGIVFGLYPAWQMARLSLGESLKESIQMTSTGGSRPWFRNGLIVGEVALAMVLSVGGALMLNSVLRLLRQDPGFDSRNLVRIEVRIPRVLFADDELRKLRFQELADRFAAMPGCTAVGTSSGRAGYGINVTPEGDNRPIFVSSKCVGVGKNDWFRTLRVPLIEGRWFEEADASQGQWSVIVNQRLARLFWPGESAVGKKIPGMHQQVVGVVGDFEEWRGSKERAPTIYEPFERVGAMVSTFYVRSILDQASLRQSVRQAVRGAFPATTEPEIEWMEQALYASTYSHRLYAHFLCAFAAAGLFLAGVGVFGVLAYSATRRTREIGIRMALGSEKHQVVGLVMKQGARLIFWGLGIGLLASLGLTRLLESQLFEVRPIDPLSILVGATVLIGVGLLASYLPARRAAKVDPVVALRCE